MGVNSGDIQLSLVDRYFVVDRHYSFSITNLEVSPYSLHFRRMILWFLTSFLIILPAFWLLFKGSRGVGWANWAENLNSKPEAIHIPSSLEELQEIVRDAKKKKLKVKVFGCTHTWSPMVHVEDGAVAIDSRKLNKVLACDEETVTIETGVIISQLDSHLESRNRCIPTNVVLSHLTWGGLVSMGCHGPSTSVECLSDLVLEMTIIIEDGSLKVFNEETVGKDEMNYIRLSLGALGVIYSIKLKTWPYFHLAMKDSMIPRNELTAELIAEHVRSNDYLEYYWFSTHQNCYLKTWKVTKEARTDTFMQHVMWYIRDFITVGFCSKIGYLFVDVIPRLMAKTCTGISPCLFDFGKTNVVSVNKGIHYFDHIDMGRKVMSFDCCFRVQNEDYSEVVRMWHALMNRCEQMIDKGVQPFFSAEIRITNGSACPLSPSYSLNPKDKFAYIEFLSFRNNGYQQMCKEMGELWMKAGALPHWPKDWQSAGESMIPYLKKQYSSRLCTFRDLCNKYDPNGMFRNKTVEALFAQ